MFSTIVANEYTVLTAPESFIHSGLADFKIPYASLRLEYSSYTDAEPSTNLDIVIESIYNRLITMTRLDNKECISEYAQDFLTRRRDVVLVSEVTLVDSEEVIRYNISTTEVGAGSNPYH